MYNSCWIEGERFELLRWIFKNCQLAGKKGLEKHLSMDECFNSTVSLPPFQSVLYLKLHVTALVCLFLFVPGVGYVSHVGPFCSSYFQTLLHSLLAKMVECSEKTQTQCGRVALSDFADFATERLYSWGPLSGAEISVVGLICHFGICAKVLDVLTAAMLASWQERI